MVMIVEGQMLDVVSVHSPLSFLASHFSSISSCILQRLICVYHPLPIRGSRHTPHNQVRMLIKRTTPSALERKQLTRILNLSFHFMRRALISGEKLGTEAN